MMNSITCTLLHVTDEATCTVTMYMYCYNGTTCTCMYTMMMNGTSSM